MELKTIPIHLSDISHRQKYIHDEKSGKHDLVGQILHALGVKVQPKTRVLTDLLSNCHPLTIVIRGEIQPSLLGIELMVITQTIPPQEQIGAANKVLTKYNAPFRLVKATK
jgi:hypothetical protein